MSDLFRRQAVDHATRRLAGEVVLASPLSLKLLGGFFVLVIAAAITFASLASYSRRETVSGWIVPQGGLIRVAARSGGVVRSLFVREGAPVAAGAPLALLSLSNDAAGGDLGQAMKLNLTAEGEAAAAQSRAARLKLQAQRTEMTARRTALEGELAETRARADILQRRQKLSEDQAARGAKLAAKGFLAPQQLDQFRAAALAAAQDTSQARAAGLELQRQLGDLAGELAAVPADLAGLDAQAAQTRAGLAQRRTAARSQTSFTAVAPLDGRVLAIPVELGQSVGAGGAVAVLTPKGSRLMAELYVPSRSAGFIREGQEVRLMYQAFPYQTFGTGRGRVASVSSTVLAPAEVAIPGLTVQEPVFRVRVGLERASVEAYGRAVALQPGMLLTADMITDRRNLVQWLLDPLYASGRRG